MTVIKQYYAYTYWRYNVQCGITQIIIVIGVISELKYYGLIIDIPTRVYILVENKTRES